MTTAHQLMSNFRSLVKAKGWSVDELFDLLKHGAMAHCQPSYSSVAKWMSGDREASGDHLLAIWEFTQTHSNKNGSRERCQSNRKVKPKTK